MIIDKVDKEIINIMCKDLPVRKDLYDYIADELKIDTSDLINRLQKLNKEGVLKRISPIMYHYKTKYKYNVMTVWKIEDNCKEEFLKKLLSFDMISHVYEREVKEEFDYNMYAMIHSSNEEDIFKIVKKIKELKGIISYDLLFTKKELKKTSPDYGQILKS
ncbi:MAG: Lrp/AsnC family transcriptional regulator [Peptostreptococcaceae bacterium]|jgi:DNA-binding Lrp family transcriptional regulator|nr:Lrp/AsnC family transcriptional regulator [Peptostreptococcaceae bacterium]